MKFYMILKYFFPFLLFISINFGSLAALPNNDNFNKLRKINFIENVELAKEKLILKDYQGVINLLSINIKSNDIPDSYLVESLINRGNAYFFTNNYDYAKADYLRCLDIELCQSADINLILGKLEVKLGNNEIAASYFKNAILLSKNNFKILSEALSFFKNP